LNLLPDLVTPFKSHFSLALKGFKKLLFFLDT